MDPQKVARAKAEGMVLLKFAISVYEWQLRRGRFFIHEHPASAASWQAQEIKSLMSRDGVCSV
eukprot:5104695-Heterocapsa_arctica.AAC.1